MSSNYEELGRRMRSRATLSAVGELLGWDQETGMPPNAAEFRAEQRSMVSTLVHREATDPRIGELLAAAEEECSAAADVADVREMRRDYERARCLPEDLVAEIARTNALAMEAWRAARERGDFAAFRPWLDKQLELNRQKADCYGIPQGGEAYDALLEDYEPGMRAAELESIFAPLREATVELIRAVRQAPVAPGSGPLSVDVPIERQRRFNEFALGAIGFDTQGGRLDVSTHPFSISLGPGDTRITTRYRRDGFLDSLGSTLHEAGHAMYEQGLPKSEFFGRPRAEAISLGIHDSQSRLWENQVGRSKAFWQWALPHAREIVAPAFDRVDADEIHGALNRVEPNLIRVESDEATYNLHIMLRFDLERAMLRGDLSTADLPAAWNQRIEDDLGLTVPDDGRGCLQDIHWAMGAIGYFPTYTLGNLYSAQLWSALVDDLGDVERQISRGEFAPLLGWLRRSVHAHGRRFPARELCRRVTGRALDHEPLMSYLGTKLRPLYGLGA